MNTVKKMYLIENNLQRFNENEDFIDNNVYKGKYRQMRQLP